MDHCDHLFPEIHFTNTCCNFPGIGNKKNFSIVYWEIKRLNLYLRKIFHEIFTKKCLFVKRHPKRWRFSFINFTKKNIWFVQKKMYICTNKQF